MELNFDKEMDALLRQSARDGETAVSNENSSSAVRRPHLDADELSAFAENALPEKIREKYVLHLADCEQCRKKLSSLIVLNADAEIQTVHAEKKEIAALPIPWYRKFFAVPNLVYALGALVVVFSGIAVFTVLQNVSDSQNAEVSQISERQPNGKGMSSDGDALPAESYSSNAASNAAMSSNMAAMNSSSAANSSSTTIFATPETSVNSNAATLREQDKDFRVEPKSLAPQSEPTDLAKTQDAAGANMPPPPPAPVRADDYPAENESQRQQPEQNSIAQSQTQIMPDTRNVRNVPKPAARADNKSRKAEESRDETKLKSAGMTSIGGKNFKRTNNVWYDAAYRGQATVNITRGTGEYKKLDSGLRGIAENLGGTVVVVWKEKAYRIQ